MRPGSELDGCTVGLSLAPKWTGAEAKPKAGAIIIASAASEATAAAQRALVPVVCALSV